MAGFADFLKGARGIVQDPLFVAGASIYQGQPVGQSMAQAQRSGMMAAQQKQQADQRDKWQQFAQNANVPGSLKPLLPFMSPAQGAGMIANSQPKQAARPWWAGANGQVDPAMLARTIAGRSVNNVNVSTGTQEKAFDKEMGKKFAGMFSAGIKSGMTAKKDLNDLKVLSQALQEPNLYTGAGGETIHGLKKTAQTLFGIPVQGVGTGELVTTLSRKAALALKGDLPGPLSNSDREYLNSLPPSLSKSPEGNRLIAELGIMQKQYEIARNQAAVNYARGNQGRMDLGFVTHLEKIEGQFGSAFSQKLQQLRSVGQAPRRSPASGVDLNALRQKYSLE